LTIERAGLLVLLRTQLNARAPVGCPGHHVAQADNASGLRRRAALVTPTLPSPRGGGGLGGGAARTGRGTQSGHARGRRLYLRITLGRLEDNVAELFRRGQPAQCVDS